MSTAIFPDQPLLPRGSSPRPNWPVEEIGPADLAVVAGAFSLAAGRVLDADLAKGLQEAAAKLSETAVARG